MLEEVPDISYDDVGGLDSQIEQITDAVELPFVHHDLFAEYRLPAPKGILLYGPPGLRQDAHRQGGGQLAGQEGGRGQRRQAGPQLLPQHQGPRAAQQVRGRDRAPDPPGLPAGPREERGGLAGHRLLRRDGLAVPHPGHRHQLRHGVDHRAPAAGRDRRGRDAQERDRDRRLQPRGPDRPGHPAPGPPRREDQDRAPQRGGRRADLRPLPRRPTCPLDEGEVDLARRRRPRQGRAGHDRADRGRDVPRRRGQPVPGGDLPERRQGGHVLQGLLVGRHDREHRAPGQEARHQAPHRPRQPAASA